MLNLSIKALSYYIPKGRMTNTEVVDKFAKEHYQNLQKDDLELLTYGCKRKLDFLEIKTRSYCKDYNEENSIQMATKVAKDVIKKANITAEDIDLLLFVGVCNPFREPSYSIILSNEIGIKGGNYYDINDTCNGFLKAMELASLYINTGKYRNILLVTSESTLEMIDSSKYRGDVKSLEEADYKMNLLFAGSGAAAMILTKDVGSKTIKYYGEQRDNSNWDMSLYVSPKITMPSDKLNVMDFISWADGRGIAAKIIKEMPGFVYKFLVEKDIDKDSIDYIFAHQLGRNITNSILNKIEVNIDKVFPVNTFYEYGNMGSANIPVGLAIAEENGLLNKGDSVLLLGSACGLTYSAAYIIW